MHPVGAGFLHALAHDGAARQICAGGQDHGLHGEHRPGGQHHGGNRAVLRADLHHLALADRQMVLLLQGVLHVLLITPPVRLGPEGPDGGALSLVQQPVLDAARVGGLRHLAPQGVQLPDQMALAGAADSGVAGHVAHRIQIDGEDDGLHPQPGGGQRRLDPGVARADHGDIKLSGEEFGHKVEILSSVCMGIVRAAHQPVHGHIVEVRDVEQRVIPGLGTQLQVLIAPG